MTAIREGGANGFSVDHLALLAGVTKRTVYRHFGSKAGLIDAVVHRELDRLRIGVVDQDPGDGDPVDQLKACARRLFDKSLEPESVAFANFVSIEVYHDAELLSRQRRWYSYIVDYIAGIVDAAQRNGSMRLLDCRLEALLLIDLINGSSQRKRYGLPDADLFAGAARDVYFEARWTAFRTLTAPHQR